MVSEKDKKIVAAVFASRGEPGGSVNNWITHIAVCVKDICFMKKGSVAHTSASANKKHWEIICTIKEYNQCIEDMARAEWLNGSVHSNYYFYKVECKNRCIDTSNKELLKEHCDYSFYDKPLVYTQDDFYQGLPVAGQTCNIKYRGGNTFNEALIMYISDYGLVHKDAETGVEIFCGSLDVVEFLPIKTPEQIDQYELDEKAKTLHSDLLCNGYCSELRGAEYLLDNYTIEPK